MTDTGEGRGDEELSGEELDERLEFDMGEPLEDAPTAEPGTGGTPDDLGRGAD